MICILVLSNSVTLLGTLFQSPSIISRKKGREGQGERWNGRRRRAAFLVKVMEGVTEKWYVKCGSGIVNEWWCLRKQQHSQSYCSELGIIYFISYASSLTFFTPIISLFTLHFESYFSCLLLLGWGFDWFWNDSPFHLLHFSKLKLLFVLIHENWCFVHVSINLLFEVDSTSNLIEILPRSRITSKTFHNLSQKKETGSLSHW